MREKPPKNWTRDTKRTWNHTLNGTNFIKSNKLWQGFTQYQWLVKGGIVILVILGFDIITSIPDLFSSMGESINQASSSNFLSNISFNGLQNSFGGGMKYLLLIALEIIIFHFTRRSMMIITGDKIDTSFKTFVKAEKRMIKVAIFSYCMETIFRILSNTVLSIFGFELFQAAMLFLIQSFYLGFAMVDNYNELFGMTLKQSHRFTWHYAPVAIITGGMVNILLNIPAIGIIIGTVICSVIATLTMHELTRMDMEKDWIFVEKEKKS